MKTLEQFESLKNNGRPFVKVLPCIFNHFHVHIQPGLGGGGGF